MTKKVRIENADNSAYKVKVEVWDKGVDGGPDTLAEHAGKDLLYPTEQTELYITSTRYLVIKELAST